MSARKLTHGHMARVVRDARQPEVTDPKKLDADQMRLYSYYRPSLQADDYVIEVSQSVTSGVQNLQINNTTAADSDGTLAPQEFEVVVPRFTIDPAIINSYYPPDGHQDEGRILPHIVLNDPHYPWEIAAGVTNNMHSEIDNNRSMVPWVALIVFDPAELNLPALADVQALNIAGFQTDADLKKQNANGTFSMPVSDYFSRIPETARINYKSGFNNDQEGYNEILGMTTAADFIFPTKNLIRSLFTDSTRADLPQNKYGIEQYKYLAHVRQINTEGCPDAGVEEEGIFSIVISSRTGALRDSFLQNDVWTESTGSLSQPRIQVCHLISIEHLDSTLDSWSSSGPSDRIGMVSLFSWVYTALPSDPVNFVTTMRNLTENQQMLRVDDHFLAQLDAVNKEAAASKDDSIKYQASNVLAERLRRGYTISRWRTQTGEETSAFTRGPLVPQPVPEPPAKNTIPDCSMTSQDYQILDPQTGLVDLSYASAWQLGKLLAISDTSFSAALMRFRSVVHNSSADQTKMAVNNMTSRMALLRSVKTTIASVQGQSAGNTGQAQRVRPPATRDVISDLKDPAVLPIFLHNLHQAIASNTAAGVDADGNPVPFNGFNTDGPSNSDWPVIHSWLEEKLSLGGIPPQYLFPEPSFVPLESLRFFYIDDFWLDCLLDGALSVANHLDSDDDVVRREIKKKFNNYLRDVVPEAGFKPQIPCYGFIMRSKLIKAIPDLRITVTWTNPDKRHPVCRWTKWDDQTVMCLLDRMPQELDSITLSQPQHQQRFALGSHIDSTAGSEAITFELRTLYTVAPGIASDGPEVPAATSKGWLDFSTRCMHIQQMATDIHTKLKFKDPSTGLEYTDPTANSCELGLELNDPSYYFKIIPPTGVDSTPQPRDRQLFVRDPASNTSASSSQQTAAQAAPPGTSPKSQGKQVLITTHELQPVTTPSFTPKPPHQQLRMPPLPSAKASPVTSSKSSKAVAASHTKTTTSKPSTTSVSHAKMTASKPSQSSSTKPSKSGPVKTSESSSIKAPKTLPARPSQGVSPKKPSAGKAASAEHIAQRSTAAPQAAFDDTPQSRFDLTIFPDYRDPPFRYAGPDEVYSATDYVPTNNIYYFDLIFSIRKRAEAVDSDYELLKIVFDIPITSTSSTSAKPTNTNSDDGDDDGPIEALIGPDDYSGPGLRMLSNQHFVPFLTTDPTASLIHIELVPRTTNFDLPLILNDRKSTEMGFRLAEPNISPVVNVSFVQLDQQSINTAVGKVIVTWTEWYRTTAAPEGEPVVSTYALIKRDLRDDNEAGGFVFKD
jgi:hypothetical protein